MEELIGAVGILIIIYIAFLWKTTKDAPEVDKDDPNF